MTDTLGRVGSFDDTDGRPEPIPGDETSASSYSAARPAPVDADWYKRAVFYEVLVRAFADSNGDGTGDLRGLIDKLDYLQWLGVDCLWLPPFYDSPLRDGGYDIRDYRKVLPEFGTVQDFADLIDAAHQRGIRVITDLVMNHTSDTHEWFQQSRTDPDGPYGDFYTWADDDTGYPDARIIFVDTEPSNWTFDPVRKQYFWHRFFSHQPDLNFDCPGVGDALIDTMRFWLDIGIDGFGSTRCPTCTCGRAPTARTCPRPTISSAGAAPSSKRNIPGGFCWPRPTNGPPTSWIISATRHRVATSVTCASTSRSCHGFSWRPGGNRGSRSRRSWPRRRPSRRPGSGASSCATTTN